MAGPSGSGLRKRCPSIQPCPAPSWVNTRMAWSSGDVRIPAAGLRHHRFDLAKQKARGVDVMNQSLIDQEPAELPEVRLLRIWLVSNPIARSRAKPVSDEIANVSPRDHLMRHPVPGLPSPILVNHQPHTGRFSNIDNLQCRCPNPARWASGR